MKISRVLIMAGGTGGHVFPALAVARELRNRGIEVAWLGSSHGFEASVVPLEKIPFYQISVTGLRGKNVLSLLKAPFMLSLSLFQAFKIIRKYRPDVVLGMGGFASGPGGLIAWVLRKRLVLHEQNAIFGLTNRLLFNFANKILTGFPIQKGVDVGNPVRSEIMEVSPPEERFKDHKGPIRLLVFGGSQGSLFFNRVMPEGIKKLSQNIQIEIWHQTGEKYLTETQEAYRDININKRVEPFITEMKKAYEWADLVICRAGALTIAELGSVGLGAILIPMPHAVDDHQTANARFMSERGAAILLNQQEFTPDKFSDMLSSVFSDRSFLLEMAKKARSLRKANATQLVVKELCDDKNNV